MKKGMQLLSLLVTVIMIFLVSGKAEADSVNYPGYEPFFRESDQNVTPGTRAAFRFDAYPGETGAEERFCATVYAWIESGAGDGTGYFQEISSMTQAIIYSHQVIWVEWDTERFGPEEYLIETRTEFYYDLADVWVPCPNSQREFVIYARNYCGENCTWKIKGSTLVISGEGPMTDFSMHSSPWCDDTFYYVVVNEGVTSIGSYAFYSQRKIYDVTLPTTLKAIGDGAFGSCEKLGEISIPGSVSSIGIDAFECCYVLWNVTLPGELKEISEGCFKDCRALEKIIIPEAVNEICYDAFSASGLQSIWIPAGLRFIRNNAFEFCDDLKTVYVYGGDLSADIEEDGNDCFLEAEMERVNYWLRVGSRWCYIGMDGCRVKGQFKEIDGKTYYFNDSGYMVTGWQKISNQWYYFNNGGDMVTGWKKISEKWYYFSPDGMMQTGWQKISNQWYYFNNGGDMVTGWKKISGKWYYFASGGNMQTGWKKISNQWYYFESSGAMTTGWKTLDGKTYFFKASGVMAAGEWCHGYWLSKDGTWTYPYKASWKQNSKGWWYGDESGWYAKNCTITIDGKSYTFNAGGYWVQ